MRMTAVVGALPPSARAALDAFATGAALAFLVLITRPAYDYALEEVPIATPALQISDALRAAAMPAGVALMATFAVLRLIKTASPREAAIALGAVVALLALFWVAEPIFHGLGNFNLLIFFVGVVAATVFAGVPIAFAFGLAVFGYLALATLTPLTVLVGRMDEGMSHLILLAVPLFVFLGLLIEMTGMARAMVAFLASLLGPMRGGLHYVLVAGMYLISGISGSKAADMAAIAPVLFPEMKERGARPGDLVALLAATGALTETVPPSLVLITIGSVTGVSIAALFAGGLLPAVVLALVLCFVVYRRHRREPETHCQAGQQERCCPSILRRAARARSPLSDPRRSSGRRCHGDGSVDDRHRLCGDRGPFVLSSFRMGGAAADAGLDSVSDRRDLAHHRHRNRYGLGPDSVRLLAHSCWGDDGPSWRRADIYGRVRAWPSSCSARCSRGFRPSYCSDRSCFRSPKPLASTRCTMRWWSSWRWGLVCSRHPLALAIMLLAPSAMSTRPRACARSGATCWRWPSGRLVVAAVPWISIGFL